MEVRMEKKKQQDSKAKFEEAIERIRKSGLKVANLVDRGIKSIGFIGGVRRPAHDEDDGDSARKPVN
jgi:hypothetical protein